MFILKVFDDNSYKFEVALLFSYNIKQVFLQLTLLVFFTNFLRRVNRASVK